MKTLFASVIAASFAPARFAGPFLRLAQFAATLAIGVFVTWGSKVDTLGDQPHWRRHHRCYRRHTATRQEKRS